MCLQNVESYSHNSKCDVESCSHNSKCDRKMLKVAVIIRNVTATFNILQSDF